MKSLVRGMKKTGKKNDYEKQCLGDDKMEGVKQDDNNTVLRNTRERFSDWKAIGVKEVFLCIHYDVLRNRGRMQLQIVSAVIIS